MNYLKNTEFKILEIIPGVVAAKREAGIRGDPCGAVRMHSTTRVTTGPERLRLPEILDNQQKKVVRLASLHTATFTPRRYSSYPFLLEALLTPEPQSIKNPNYPIGNRTRELPDFRAVRQPTVIPRAPITTYNCIFFLALQPPLGVVFYSPLAGFSLLACEVS